MDRVIFDSARGTALAVLCLFSALTGCNAIALVGAAAGLDQVPAECRHLEGKKVAVVCVADSNSTGANIESREFVQQLEQVLRAKVSGIRLVSQSEIDNWKDNHDWKQIDFREVGRGVKAEVVLAINIKSFELYAGSQSMYRGRTELDLQVFDMKDKEKVVWRKNVPEIRFPVNAEDAAIGKNERQFTREFVSYLAARLGRYFHSYEPHETFLDDHAFLSK